MRSIPLSKENLPGGTIHPLPADIKDMLLAHPAALVTWQDITPLARNEWICWMSSGKKDDTRTKRISVGCSQLTEGQRRPCCWPGCPHR